MKAKRITALLLSAAVLLFGGVALAAGGTSDDPLVTLSSLKTSFLLPVEKYLKNRTDALSESSLSRLDAQTWSDTLESGLDKQLETVLTERVSAEVSRRLAAKGTGTLTANMTAVTLKKGQKIVGTPGAAVILRSGTGTICGTKGSSVLNVTAGGLRTPGSVIRTDIFYMVLADDGSGVEITSENATALVKDGWRIEQPKGAYTAKYTAQADALKTLGLFFGSNKGYELERVPTRQEALIMLIRLMGEDADALAYTGTTTFGDVTGWAEGQRYIAYGEHRGFTNGNGLMPDGRIQFTQYGTASLEMYLTFVLRALGYNDAAGDFVWNTTSRTLAVRLGLLTDAEITAISSTGLLRDHVVLISYRALWANLKTSTSTLGDKLVSAGVLTRDALNAAAGQK